MRRDEISAAPVTEETLPDEKLKLRNRIEPIQELIRHIARNMSKGETTTVLFRQACVELLILRHNNKKRTAEEIFQLAPSAFSNAESCRGSMRGWSFEPNFDFEEHLNYFVEHNEVMIERFKSS